MAKLCECTPTLNLDDRIDRWMAAFTAKKLVTMLETVLIGITGMTVVIPTKVVMATERKIIVKIIIIAITTAMEEVAVRVDLVEEGVHTQGLDLIHTLLGKGTMEGMFGGTSTADTLDLARTLVRTRMVREG